MAMAIQLCNPLALNEPPVAELFRRAFEATPDAAPNGIQSVVPDIVNAVTDPDAYFVVMGVADGKPAGLIMGHYPANGFYPYPTLFLLYTDPAVPGVKRAMQEKLVDILLERGYTTMWAMNGTGRPDEVWERAMACPGVAFQPLGTVYAIGIE